MVITKQEYERHMKQLSELHEELGLLDSHIRKKMKLPPLDIQEAFDLRLNAIMKYKDEPLWHTPYVGWGDIHEAFDKGAEVYEIHA